MMDKNWITDFSERATIRLDLDGKLYAPFIVCIYLQTVSDIEEERAYQDEMIWHLTTNH